jgi:hypothetical protein
MAKASAEPGTLELEGAFARWNRTAGGPRAASGGARPTLGASGLQGFPMHAPSAEMQHGLVAGRAHPYGEQPDANVQQLHYGGGGFAGGSLAKPQKDPEIVGRLEDALRVLVNKANTLSERSSFLLTSPAHPLTTSPQQPLGYPSHYDSYPTVATPAFQESGLFQVLQQAPAAPQPRALSALHAMSEEDVSHWLQGIGLGDYADAFHQAGFSGASLAYLHTLASTTPQTYLDRAQGLGMKLGHAARLAESLRAALAA